MVDDMSSHWVMEPKRVNIEDAGQLRYWLEVLDTDEHRLRRAVGRAGTSPDAVRAELRGAK